MALPLLKTKLNIPPVRPELVPRSRLIERLEEGARLGCKLTLVSAPAGFGKTTLVSEWVAGCETRTRVAWVSLDEGDDDVTRFWSYAILALQTLDPALGQNALGALQAAQAQPPALEPLLISLVNDLSTLAMGEFPFLLVLDDYHVLKTTAIHESVDYLLDHLPPVLRLIVLSREDPPLALSLLRGRGQLCEIRAADLRFTPTETTEYLNAVMDLGLSASDIAALSDRTEGWVVGLHLAALSLRGRTDLEAHEFVSAFAGDDRYVADYLLDQVLDGQTPTLQRFLLQTSILERLCGPLCDAVTATPGTPREPPFAAARQILAYLDRTGLFVIPLDNRRQWYRYHHLFADLLRNRLHAMVEPMSLPEVATLHLRASAWYEGEGLIAEAMDHALAAEDYERAADLLQRHFRETIWFGEWALMLKWLEALPEVVVRSRPFLCMLSAVFVTFHSSERAEAWLQAAEKAWEGLGRPLQRSDGPPALIDREVFDANVVNIRLDIAEARGASSREIIELTLDALEGAPESMPSLRGSLLQRLAWHYLDLGDEETADRHFLQAKTLGEVSGHHGGTLAVACGRAVIAWRHSRLHDVVAICQQALRSTVEPLERTGRRLPAAGNLYMILGRILLEWYELERAEAMLVKGVALAELAMPARSSDLLDGYHALACLRCIEGDFAGALAWMDKAARTCTWAPEGVRALWARIWLWRARVEMDRHLLDLALAWARECDMARPAEDDWSLQSLAQVFIAGHRVYGEPDLAPLHSALSKELLLTEAADRTDQVIRLLVLEALALQAEGQIDRAMAPLERVLTLAAPHGYTLTFVQYGAPMGALLREAAARGINVAYAHKLLAALARETGDQGQEASASGHPAQLHLLDPLSSRELEVLRLLATTLTGPEIADELVVSVNTLRTHTKHIYGKLQVHSRIEAAERARDLGLI